MCLALDLGADLLLGVVFGLEFEALELDRLLGVGRGGPRLRAAGFLLADAHDLLALGLRARLALVAFAQLLD